MTVNERWLEILLTPLRDGITVAETCRRCGVGVTALQPRSRRPHSSPNQTDPEVEARIVEMRTHNPRWGATAW
ncbi:helix-turn-helix domain-containing protein [Rhodococcus sp. HM1]|uniref:helix-turn-helix domain-containing protein n=1 Tax=Rhodococcus sp. HM1 TaxID=2937759 RepID=UPI002009E54E|nr:helix-turn-helix domain-containing protein [Rhodococcus sp. HM1]MCK8675174.1 helix-turn-helix domain-containing protein [Rhodococcus sp. HM1]